MATDHLESERLHGLSVDDLFDIAVRHRLHFDPARQIGVVFHMMSALAELGRTGMTAVGDSPQQAERALPPRGARARRGGGAAGRAAAAARLTPRDAQDSSARCQTCGATSASTAGGPQVPWA